MIVLKFWIIGLVILLFLGQSFTVPQYFDISKLSNPSPENATFKMSWGIVYDPIGDGRTQTYAPRRGSSLQDNKGRGSSRNSLINILFD